MSTVHRSLAAVLLAVFGATAMAQTVPTPMPKPVKPHKHPGITYEQRHAAQERRIEEGLRKGTITPAEAAQMRSQEAAIEAQRSAAMADGTLTPEEKHRLNQAQKQVGRQIHQERHDGKR